MPNKKNTLIKNDLSEQDEITFADSNLFNLESFAKNLRFLFDFPVPLTIIIDGGWGTGKTVFAKQLNSMMGDRAHYINAFAHDYQDDVFTALLLSVKQAVKPKGKFNEEFANVLLHHIVPNLTNELIKKVSGINVKDLVNAKAKEAAHAYIENVENRQKMLDIFRNKLKQHMEQKEKPVVILVDELDRCKPKYALQVLEIIKHLYSVPKIHFVLVMNTKQVINTIRHEHGCNEEEAKIYLQKFYDLMISLPGIGYSLSDSENISKDSIEKYILFKSYEMVKKGAWISEHSYFGEGFIDLAYGHQLSLREIDKIFLLLNIIFCYPSQNSFDMHILVILLLIWLRNPSLFTQILNHYVSHNAYVVPDAPLIRDIHKFLHIKFIKNDDVQEYWDEILCNIWDTGIPPRSNNDATSKLIQQVRHLALLTSFSPPPKK